MIHIRIVTLCVVAFSGQLFASDGIAMLDRMSESMRVNNYSGIFVYRHKDKVETLKIIHRKTEEGIDERLITLSGKPSEIIRDDNKVTCIWPEKRFVLLDKNRHESRFPGMVPSDLSSLPEFYSISVNENSERVAGRPSYVVDIKPKDHFRYGYRLWIDRESYLLTRSDLLDEKENAIEQVMFTELEVYDSLPDSMFESEYLQEGYRWKEIGKFEQPKMDPVRNWQARSLPPGFAVQTYNKRKKPTQKIPVEHIVFSDGMASVSVFVESKNDGKNKKHVQGNTRRGALSIYRREISAHRVTVLGVVPESTVKLIAESIQSK